MDELTEQERQILVLVAKGMSNRDVASEMGFTEGTIRQYVSRIYGKIEIEGHRPMLVAWAIGHGFGEEAG